MEGAAAMSALAALRSGAGLTTILALDEPEESLRRRMVNLVPEAIIQSINLSETELMTKQFEKI
jgi:NAD(P)H-hydrate repair Nnr-like enzyme with NAD(P)H-hydrate dehydratase domain